MKEQYCPIYHTNPSNVVTPENANKIRLFRSALDNLYYIKKSDETFELFGSGIGTAGAIHLTYAQILAQSIAGTLIEGGQYVITDFRTRHIIPNTAVVNVGPIEPLLVVASSSTEIRNLAFSTIRNQDRLNYELVDSTTAGGDRGRIYFREDTISKIIAWYDWRVVLFRRWDDGAGNFTVLTNNLNAFADFYTFNNSPDAILCEQTILEQITEYGILTFGAPTDLLNNFVLNGICLDNHFQHDNFNSTIIATTIAANRTQPAFINNTAVGGEFIINTIQAAFVDNVIGSDFQQNTIGFQSINNTIGNSFIGNFIGSVFALNTIGVNFQNNIIGDNYILNVINDSFEGNQIGNSFGGNIINNSFNNNLILNRFENNSIGNNFSTNNVGFDFASNTNIGDNFQINTITPNLTGIDFALATHVYLPYSKTIFQNSTGAFRLSYIDGADVVQYANPNS